MSQGRQATSTYDLRETFGLKVVQYRDEIFIYMTMMANFHIAFYTYDMMLHKQCMVRNQLQLQLHYNLYLVEVCKQNYKSKSKSIT